MVGSIGLAGTMSMNVMERTREIGVMRAIGASNGILMSMVMVEGVLIGLISWLLGSLLAFPISKLMADSISLALFDAPSNLGFTPTGFLIWLVVVVILSILASVMPARSAARLTIREVLAYE
jgi:putative ABC transport system permease protein